MDLNFESYQELSRRTRKKFENIKDMQADVGLGLAGEAGEVADIIKKDFSGAKPLNKQHLIEELGDVLWYLAEACDCYNTTLQEIAQNNIEKLAKRFPNGFDGYGIRN